MVRSARAPKSRGEDPTCHDERVSDDLVSVLWTSSLVEAEIAKGRLEAESIPVQLIGEGADDPFPVGPAELLVPSSFEEDAPHPRAEQRQLRSVLSMARGRARS
jgi:hypothetical protein